MKLNGKNIILISPEPWSHIFVSKHHYALELSKNNKVFFLNPPSKAYSISPTEYENLNVIDYPKFLPGLRFFPDLIRKRIFLKVFRKIQDLCNCDLDIIWSFDNSVFYDLDIFSNEVFTISHIVDQNQNFQFKKCAQNADLCLGVIQPIVDHFLKYNSNSYLISHGLFLPEANDIEQIELPGNSKIKSIYIGNLSMEYLDRALLFDLLNANKDVDFIFIGSNATDPSNNELMKIQNAYFLSPVSHRKVQSYLQAADICLIVYNSNYKSEYASPHKFLEYLYSGKVIISTLELDEFKNMDEDLFLCSENPTEFLRKFDTVKQNINSKYNTESLKQKRKDLAINNSYSRKIEQIENLLSET